MKTLLGLKLLSLLVSCDPYKFGFKKNPAAVINDAYKAIQSKDLNAFLALSAGEALCTYGNEQGISYLQQNLHLNLKALDYKHSRLDVKPYTLPAYVKFWSYYHERYQINVVDKESKQAIVDLVIDCEYGANDKDAKLVGKLPTEYKKKECRLMKIIPHQFEGLPFTSRCRLSKVD